MHQFNSIKIKVLLGLIFLLNSAIFADVSMPHIFSDNMVLQRNTAINVWGWADENEKVTVTLDNKSASATADSLGNWSLKLPAFKAGGPLKMTIKGNNEIVFENVLIGEVWLCSGQSNMQFGLASVFNAEQEIKNANYPNIRLFAVPNTISGVSKEDFNSRWRICTPKEISNRWGSFSAVAYFFGREIHEKTNVPVGLIASAWGGSHIEAWIPEDGFSFSPKLHEIAKYTKKTNQQYRKKIKKMLAQAEKKPNCFGSPFVLPRHPFDVAGGTYPQNPTCLYNSMIHPLVPYSIKGAIWYQGESNKNDGMLYCDKMKAMIGSWRNIWCQGKFPFYYAQIAPHDGSGYGPGQLPMLWQAQTKALEIKNTGMVVTTDLVDDIKDIHPKNKQDVGKRLALWALAKDYGFKDIIYCGPLYKSMKIQDNKIRIYFDYTAEGLQTKDGNAPSHFQIAAADKKFVDAVAEIDGDTIIISSEKITKPVAVRYAWHKAALPNLCNSAKLPASPFRTDDW